MAGSTKECHIRVYFEGMEELQWPAYHAYRASSAYTVWNNSQQTLQHIAMCSLCPRICAFRKINTHTSIPTCRMNCCSFSATRVCIYRRIGGKFSFGMALSSYIQFRNISIYINLYIHIYSSKASETLANATTKSTATVFVERLVRTKRCKLCVCQMANSLRKTSSSVCG